MRRVSCDFAFAIDAVDPLLGCAAIGALGLKGRDEELGDLVGAVGLIGDVFGRKAALEPGEQLGLAPAGAGLQFGDDDHFELEALGFVDGHQLDAAVAARPRDRAAR